MVCYAVQNNQSQPGAFRAKAHCVATPVGFSFGDHDMKRLDVSTAKHLNMYVIVDDMDYERVMRFSWTLQIRHGIPYARCKMNMGRISGMVQNCQMQLHRYILKPPLSMDIDHRNHNGLDCRRSNMRICTTSQNICNQLPIRGGSSKFKGVSWRKQGKFWTAKITLHRKQIHLGSFQDEREAALAYDARARILHGDFACTNF